MACNLATSSNTVVTAFAIKEFKLPEFADLDDFDRYWRAAARLSAVGGGEFLRPPMVRSFHPVRVPFRMTIECLLSETRSFKLDSFGRFRSFVTSQILIGAPR